MNFKQWYLENQAQVFQIPIGQLLMTKEEIAAAVDNLSRGLPSVTQGPLEVRYHEAQKRYQLVNGYHRLVETLMRGQSDVQVMNTGPAEWRFPSPNELFVPDWDEEYYGMENFIEIYLLKRI